MATTFMTIDRHIDDSLEDQDKATLNKMTYAELVSLCQDRELKVDDLSKSALIEQLLDWKKRKPVPGPSTPRLSRSSSDGMQTAEDERQSLDSRYLASLFLNEDEDQIPYEKLVFGRKLGSGGFKDCFAGVYERHAVAIGQLRLSSFSPADIREVKNEIDVLKQLRHENITRFVGVCTHPQHLCIVTELCENGDLFDFMRKFKKPNLPQQIMFMHDIALGVSYLHARRPSIIHRDLKSMNILISADSRAKINDFGLARIRPRANISMHTQVGTPNWQAPEFWTINPSYTEKVDVYACGLIFWEILSWAELGFPFQDLSEHDIYQKVRDEGHRPSISRLGSKIPTSLLKLIQRMWARDPSYRPTMNHVLESLAEFLV